MSTFFSFAVIILSLFLVEVVVCTDLEDTSRKPIHFTLVWTALLHIIGDYLPIKGVLHFDGLFIYIFL